MGSKMGSKKRKPDSNSETDSIDSTTDVKRRRSSRFVKESEEKVAASSTVSSEQNQTSKKRVLKDETENHATDSKEEVVKQSPPKPSPAKPSSPQPSPPQPRRAACIVAEDSFKYTASSYMCPFPGCASKGHISGRYDTHRTLAACPLYHNMSAEECKERYQKRRETEQQRLKLADVKQEKKDLRKVVISSEQKSLKKEVALARARYTISEEAKVQGMAHKNYYSTNREPLLVGLTSDYDKELFRRAQARACELEAYEINNHYHLSGENAYRIRLLELGPYEMETWYTSPYPEEYSRLPKIYVCEYCLKYMKTGTISRRHSAKCIWRHPPGDEIYRQGTLSVFEVDGKKNKIYCQNLCLLAKLFLDHKTLYYDVEPFLFYIMTEADVHGCHLVGYFSKEKQSFLSYNLSCILTLPPYMKQGYGRMLIDLSYLLSKVEHKIGSPEKPLSDLGLLSYRSYWKHRVLDYLTSHKDKEICIKDISQETSIHANDIVSTLQLLGMLKYWKGKHVLLKKKDIIEQHMHTKSKKKSDSKTVDASCLKWTPPKTDKQT